MFSPHDVLEAFADAASWAPLASLIEREGFRVRPYRPMDDEARARLRAYEKVRPPRVRVRDRRAYHKAYREQRKAKEGLKP